MTAAAEALRGTATDAPPLQGISHLAFSVADLPAATDFWIRVMAFELTIEGPGFCFLVHRGVRLGLGLADHEGTVEGRFDEHHVGLDHVALAVSDLSTLEAWARRLQDCGVPHSPIVASDARWTAAPRTPAFRFGAGRLPGGALRDERRDRGRLRAQRAGGRRRPDPLLTPSPPAGQSLAPDPGITCAAPSPDRAAAAAR